MRNKRENVNYSLFESSKVDENGREEDGEKGKTKIYCNYPRQVELDFSMLGLSSQHRGYSACCNHTSRITRIRQY